MVKFFAVSNAQRRRVTDVTDEKPERVYPVKSLHDFLYELDKEWDKFRTGSMIGVIVSCILLVFAAFRLLSAIRTGSVLDFVFMIVVLLFLIYTVHALFVQHRFFRRWERRIGLLMHLEEHIISETLDDDAP